MDRDGGLGKMNLRGWSTEEMGQRAILERAGSLAMIGIDLRAVWDVGKD